jgi:hypothetical protein
MWVFTETGFVSAVRKAKGPDVLTVRSRDRKSLEPLAQIAQQEIIETPFGDYQYRLLVASELFASWVADQATDVGYDNFKNQVAKTRGYGFASALNDVWVAMLKTFDQNKKLNSNN